MAWCVLLGVLQAKQGSRYRTARRLAGCPSQVKTAIAAQLPWSSMAALLEDPEPGVRVRPGAGVGRGVQA